MLKDVSNSLLDLPSRFSASSWMFVTVCKYFLSSECLNASMDSSSSGITELKLAVGSLLGIFLQDLLVRGGSLICGI